MLCFASGTLMSQTVPGHEVRIGLRADLKKIGPNIQNVTQSSFNVFGRLNENSKF